MADTGKPNPYQLYTNPLPIPPSSGGVGDFLREITTFRGAAPSQVTVPTAVPVNPYGVLPGPETYKNLPVAPAVTQTASRQVQPIAAPVAKQPALNNFLPPANRQQINKQNLDYNNPEARVVAPRGYTSPTPEDIATSNAVSKAYWAPYVRQQAIQNEGLAIRRLEAQAKFKQPTLRDQLYGQAAEAANALYKLNSAKAKTTKATGWFTGQADHDRAIAEAEQKSYEDYLKNMLGLVQPNLFEMLQTYGDTK